MPEWVIWGAASVGVLALVFAYRRFGSREVEQRVDYSKLGHSVRRLDRALNAYAGHVEAEKNWSTSIGPLRDQVNVALKDFERASGYENEDLPFDIRSQCGGAAKDVTAALFNLPTPKASAKCAAALDALGRIRETVKVRTDAQR